MKKVCLILSILFFFSACSSNMEPNEVNKNYVDLETGNVAIQLSFSSEEGGLASGASDWYGEELFNSGMITLLQSTVVAYQKPMAVDGNSASGSILGVAEGDYQLKVEFFNFSNTLTFEGVEDITVTPGETTIGNVELLKQF